jgi:uncharacterized protein
MEHLFSDVIAIDAAMGFAAAFLAAAMTAYAGFGGGLVIVPLFAILFGPIQGIVIAAICGMIGQAQLVPNAAMNARWSECGPLYGMLLITIPLGTVFMVSVDPEIIRFGIGGFVLVSALILMSNINYRGPRGALPSAIVGLLAGGVMGAFGVPAGPLLVIYFLASTEPPRVQRANIVLGVFIMTAMVLISLAARGVIGAGTLGLAFLIAPGSILGAMLGRHLFKIVPTTWFKHVACWLLVAIGTAVIAT